MKDAKELAVKMEDQVLIGKDSTSVVKFLIEIIRACHSSTFHEGDTVRLYREFMNGTALPTIMDRLILSSTNTNRHEGTITPYEEVVSHLLRGHCTDLVIAKDDEEMRNAKQGSLTRSDSSRKL